MTHSVHVRRPAIPVTGDSPEPTDDLPWIENGGKVAPKDARVLSRLFLDRLQELEEGTREYQYARNTLIEMNLSDRKSTRLNSSHNQRSRMPSSA